VTDPVIIGNATLYLGDCLEVMKQIPDGSVDMILCDLPYGTTACKWDTVIPFEPLWEQYRRVAKRNAAIVLTASQPFTSALVMSNPSMFRHEWVWEKNRGSNFMNVKREPMKEHEVVLVFSAGGWTYNPQMQERKGSGKALVGKTKLCAVSPSEITRPGIKPKLRTMPELRVPSSVQRFNTACGADKFHPTQKPVALMEYMIRTYTNEGEVVLDNCMGSGTTGVACANTGRRFIGIELEPKYFDIACKRIEQAQKKAGLFDQPEATAPVQEALL